jgi:hypothetical protein
MSGRVYLAAVADTDDDDGADDEADDDTRWGGLRTNGTSARPRCAHQQTFAVQFVAGPV